MRASLSIPWRLFLAVALLPARPRMASASMVQDLSAKLVGGCWACDLLERAGGIGFDVAQQAFDATAKPLTELLALLLALSLLLVMGRVFLPFGGDGQPSRLWNQAARRLALFALCVGALQNGAWVGDMMIAPLFSLGTTIAARLLSDLLQSSCSSAGGAAAGLKDALAGMRCPLSTTQTVFSQGLLTGVAMTLGATWHGWLDVIKIWCWSGQIVQMISGVVLAMVYAFGFLAFPLFFLDTVLAVAIVAVFAPLAIACGLFPGTRRVTGQALRRLAHSALTMVFVAVATGLASRSIDGVYAGLGRIDGGVLSDGASLVDALEAGDLKLSLVDQAYWAILAVGVMTIFLIRGAAGMASSLTGMRAGFTGATSGVALMVAGGLQATLGRLGGRSRGRP